MSMVELNKASLLPLQKSQTWDFTLGACSYPWLAGTEGMEKKMETTILGCIGTTRRIHSFIPS